MQNSTISQPTATTYTFDFPRRSTKSFTTIALLVYLLFYYSVTLTFSFAAFTILLLTTYKAVIARRIFAGETWIGIYLVSAVVSAIFISLALASSPSLIIAGLSGLMGAIDMSTWRIRDIAKKGHTIDVSNRMEIIVNIVSYLLLFSVACDGDGSGIWHSVLTGSIVGWACGYVVSLRGTNQLLVSPDLDINVVSVNKGKSGFIESIVFSTAAFPDDDYHHDNCMVESITEFNRANEPVMKYKMLLGTDSVMAKKQAAEGQLRLFADETQVDGKQAGHY